MSAVSNGALHLDRDLSNVSRARHWLLEQLRPRGDVPRDRLDEAGLMLSELVTNVFRHTTSEARVVLHTEDTQIRVEVHDDDGGRMPVLRPVDPLRTGGNGIRILDAFSSAWGCDHHLDDGKDVWFTIAW